MKPIRYFTFRNTVWYNVMDYTKLLLDTNTIWRVRPSPFGKRKRQEKTVEQVVFAKLNRLNQVYRLKVNQEVYADWVIFEHLYRVLKPFVAQPTDWTNPDSLLRQLQAFIDHAKRQPEPKGIDACFTKIQFESSD